MAKTAKKSAVVPGHKAHPNRAKAVKARANSTQSAPKAGSIHNRTMLVALTVTRWHIGRNDSTVDGEVGKAYNVEAGMGHYRKLLVRKEYIAGLRQAEAKMRESHYALTLPWEDNGYRILSNAAYWTYMEQMNGLIEQYGQLADEFVEKLEEIKEDAKTRLGSLYNEADYPTRAQLRSLYRAKLSVRNLSNSEDFRVDLGSEADVAQIRAQMDAELKAQLAESHKHVWGRLQEVVSHAADRLKAYTVSADGKVSHPFRESLIGNIKDMVELIPFLNVVQDPELIAFAARVQDELASYSVETLRSSDSDRAKAITSADDILKKMANFL